MYHIFCYTNTTNNRNLCIHLCIHLCTLFHTSANSTTLTLSHCTITTSNLYHRDKKEHAPSPKDILTEYLSDICEVVLDPEKLANDLYFAKLITFHMKDRVLTTSSYSRYDKVSRLVISVGKLLTVDDPKTFLTFCDVLKTQDDENLTRITQDMLRKFG